MGNAWIPCSYHCGGCNWQRHFVSAHILCQAQWSAGTAVRILDVVVCGNMVRFVGWSVFKEKPQVPRVCHVVASTACCVAGKKDFELSCTRKHSLFSCCVLVSLDYWVIGRSVCTEQGRSPAAGHKTSSTASWDIACLHALL